MIGRERGFTLIEVLVVLVVAGLLIVMLHQAALTEGQASRVWGWMVTPRRDYQDVEDTLRRTIERMDPGVWPDIALVRGTRLAVAFSTELPDPDTGGPMSADVRLGVENGALVLLWTPRGHGIPFGTPPPPGRIVLLGHVARIALSYASREAEAVWSEKWSARSLPGLIRIQIVAKEGEAPWPPIIVRPRREQVAQ